MFRSCERCATFAAGKGGRRSRSRSVAFRVLRGGHERGAHPRPGEGSFLMVLGFLEWASTLDRAHPRTSWWDPVCCNLSQKWRIGLNKSRFNDYLGEVGSAEGNQVTRFLLPRASSQTLHGQRLRSQERNLGKWSVVLCAGCPAKARILRGSEKPSIHVAQTCLDLAFTMATHSE